IGIHRSNKDHKFYYRAGDSFKQMPVYMIMDRMGRRPQPNLILEIKVITTLGQTWIGVEIHYILKNIGQMVAKYPAVSIEKWEPTRTIQTKKTPWKPSHTSKNFVNIVIPETTI